MATQGRPRTPGLVYGVLSVAVVALLAVFALTTRQPPPPTIAEFAPQAVEQIKDAPSEQSSEFGSGEGGAGVEGLPPGATSRPTPTPGPREVISVPRVRKCVGDPPRQIEDPQSPPCVPYWSGENGGSTARGVTDDGRVRIMFPTDGSFKDTLFEKFEAFFNKRFEFYGRKLEFVYGRDDFGGAGQSNQDADANAAVANEIFASTFYRAAGGYVYSEKVASSKVIAITGLFTPGESGYLRSFRPYMWQYWMAADRMFASTGDWACRRLVRRNARWSGDATRQTRERVFGLIVQTNYAQDKTTGAAFEEELARCGAQVADRAHNQVKDDPTNPNSNQSAAVDPAQSRNVMLRMQQKDVSTIVCFCSFLTAGSLMKAATTQGYFPEWIFTTYQQADRNTAAIQGSWPAEQMRNAFGLTFQPRQIKPENEPYRWAVREIDPNYTDDGASGTVGLYTADYRALLLIASGVQMAGPNLTPETFEQGLQRGRFPSPDHPNRPGAVGFAGGSHSMTVDGAEFWFQPGGRSPFTGQDPTTICYVDGGRRYPKGEWPTSEPRMFEEPCDSGA